MAVKGNKISIRADGVMYTAYAVRRCRVASQRYDGKSRVAMSEEAER